MEITINIDKQSVFDEVNKTSGYIGAKSQDLAQYDRTALVQANDEQLDRFWDEACSLATTTLAQWLMSDGSDDDHYNVVLRPSAAWNNALQSSVEMSLKGYLVNSILAKWLMIVGSTQVDGYAKLASSQLADVEVKMYQLTAPTL